MVLPTVICNLPLYSAIVYLLTIALSSLMACFTGKTRWAVGYMLSVCIVINIQLHFKKLKNLC